MPGHNLTDAAAQKAAPSKLVYWDHHKDAPRGFGLRVTPAGARSWVLRYRRKSDGRQRMATIGDAGPAWPIAKARKRAAALRHEIDLGRDPLGEAQERRAAPTVAVLVERYVAEILPQRAPGTQVTYRRLLDGYILPALGKKQVAAVERSDVAQLHRRITQNGHTRRANAVVTMVHTLFGYAVEWSMRLEHSNPAARIERNTEHGRERYLSDEEIIRLNAALDRWRIQRPDSVDMITLLLLTGARRGEVVGMEWSHIDLDAGIWTKPPTSTKQRKSHRVPLSPEAVALLRCRDEKRRKLPRVYDDRVFPWHGNVAERLEHDWQAIRRTAELPGVRLHDLRHSYASLLVASGLSLPIIGRLLGHTQAQTTLRYAHLADKPLREATAIVGKRVTGK
jgi:integrase